MQSIPTEDPLFDELQSGHSTGVAKGFFVEATYVGNNGRHLIRQPDLNQPSFAALNANLTVQRWTERQH